VLEAAILSLRTHPNPRLQALVDARIQEIAATEPRGNGDFEVAATYYAATGRADLIERAKKSADALYDDFRANNPPFSGGERDAINCIQLYRATHDKKHLDLAKHYLDIRGLDNSVNRSRHNQSYKPVLEQSEAVGHAVNCVSLMVSLADVGVLTGITAYLDAAKRMWLDAVERKMYVTGGVGSTGNEGFGEPYSLPNISAYAETCAVLMFITLNHRLFLATGDAKYIDVMERGMYNNAIDGVSSSGNRFFYVNRLASAGDGRDGFGAELQIGGGIGVLIEALIFELLPNEPAVGGGQFVFRLLGVTSQSFSKSGFHLLKGVVREGDQPRARQRYFQGRAVAQKGRKGEGTILQRRLNKQPAQTRGDPARHERIIVAPEIDPGSGFDGDFVDQTFADRKIAFPKTFFADGVGRGIEKARGGLVRSQLFQALGCFNHDREAGKGLGRAGEFFGQGGEGLQLVELADGANATRPELVQAKAYLAQASK
jgi:hypothetical protein